MHMRRFLLAVSAALTLAGACASAQTFPTKPVRLIVPFAPGGGTDIVARALAIKLGEALGQTVIVDNRAGAGGTVGSEAAAKAPPDGYTLGMATSSTHGVAPSLYPKLGYHPARDFAPVTLVASTPFLLSVHPSLPVRTVQDVISLARKRPGELNYASAGNGSSNHLTVEMFNMMAGVRMVHIPYKGSGPALVDLMAGQVHLMINDLSSSIGYVRSDKIRAIAVTSLARNPAVPDVPTIDESGLKGYDATAWYGLLAPKGTPEPIVRRLYDETLRAIADPGLRKHLRSRGLEPVGNTPAEFRSFIEAEVAKWARVVKASGTRLQ